MKSKKQRRAEMQAHRAGRKVKKLVLNASVLSMDVGVDKVPCDVGLLELGNCIFPPVFARRGYYLDIPFQCVDCQRQEIWRAERQKWWYEVAKGHLESTANRCNACRRIERERRNEARRVHLAGMARKNAALK